MKSCFGYVRVSTLKQGDGVSLDAQKEAILEYSRRKGLVISKWWEERETAAKQGRPVFNQMIQRLNGGEARGLVIHKIDRSARNYHDWAMISDLADTGVEFHIATESFDFNTYGGRMAADFMAVVAANYIRNLKAEVRKGQLGQLRAGLLPWAAPVGYQNNGAAQLKTPDPIMGPKVRQAFELYASGTFSIRGLVQEMKKRGLLSTSGRPLHKTGVEKMLNNPFYCGVIRVQKTGETFKGAHQPLITAELFQRVQEVKSGKKVKRQTRRNHLYRGLFTCKHCRRSLIGELHKGRVYYRCQLTGCGTRSVREDAVTASVKRLLVQLSLEPKDHALIGERLPALVESQTNEAEVAALSLRKDQTASRLDRLTDMHLDGLIDREGYQAKKEALLVEQRQIVDQLQAASSRALTEDDLRRFLELTTNLATLYDSATKQEKRRIVEWATLNRTSTGNSVSFEPSKWLLDTKRTLAALSSAHRRDNSRTLNLNILCTFRHFAQLQRGDARLDGHLD